ncbi:uncharacterized protein LOC134214990 [Armigeres subalbatus]|uniref:uncharacterized protein LOC134214990 n=1 Tax=Armigeres subalbatus TaxID=124917 RepID=UPI002ED16BF0
MEPNSCRTFGFAYIVLSWLFSTLGVIYSFLHIVVGKPFCVNILCYNDKISIGIVTICLVIFILSAVFIAFVKSAIEQADSTYIRIYRPVIVLRNLLLLSLWSYQYVMLEMERDRGNDTSGVREAEYVALASFFITLVITCLELWILHRIQRLAKLKLVEEECVEAVYSAGD